MARQSYYAVYVLFKTEEEAAAWESRLPARPEGDAATWEVLPSTALRDGGGGYFEGVFRKLAGRDGDTIASIVRSVPERCWEPRKDGFVWQDLAALATAKPEAFAKGYVEVRDAEEAMSGVGVVGVSAGEH